MNRNPMDVSLTLDCDPGAGVGLRNLADFIESGGYVALSLSECRADRLHLRGGLHERHLAGVGSMIPRVHAMNCDRLR